jgi:hypothetical protein
MRFITYDELMTMPAGTVYQEYHDGRGQLDPSMVFGGQIGIGLDFTEAMFLPILNFVSSLGDGYLREHKLDDKLWAVWYPSGFGRNGFFERKGTFLLWEEADRKRYAEWLLDPEKLANEVNDDDIVLVPVPIE